MGLKISSLIRPGVLFVGLSALSAGCQGPSAAIEITDDSFFPAPPELPLVQYVRSFNGSPDFRKRNAFLDYLAGAEEDETYEINKAFSVATWKGRIYVTDSFGLQGLNVFDLEHERFYILGKEPGASILKKPIHVFVDDQGFKFVSDLLRRQVVVYGPDDGYVRAYGDGRSFLPVSCVATEKEVYILDMRKDKVPAAERSAEFDEVRRDQIVVLDRRTGEALRRIGGHGAGSSGFSFASFLAMDRRGDLYVSDFLNYRVVKLDPVGNALLSFGRHGDRAGDFAQMKGVAVDREGLIYVADAATQIVQVFDNSGLPLFVVGGPRAARGPMNLPAGVWIDYHNVEYFRDLYAPDFEVSHLILVANQLSSRHRIAVYAYGRRRGVEYPSTEKLTTLDRASRKPLWRFPVFAGDRPEVEAGASSPIPSVSPSSR